MSGRTIESILSEIRGEAAELSALEKAASAQPQKSSSISPSEVEKMASMLEQAEFSDVEKTASINETLIAAAILNQAMMTMSKEASAPVEEPELSEHEIKVAHFIKSAKEQGFSEEDIKSFVEKKAGVGSFLKKTKDLAGTVVKSKAGKAALGLGTLAGAGAAGNEFGEHTEREKAKKILPMVFRAGAERGFQAGAYASNSAWKKALHNRGASTSSGA